MSPTVALIHAHPSAERSLANRELLEGLGGLDFVDRRDLYDLYPDFDIDVDAERARLARVDLVVLQHPIYWYSMPALMKLWIDEVFGFGWAYGPDGRALVGKALQWVVTAGGDARAYAADGPHGHPFETFVAPIRQTALFCGMHWSEPIVVQDAHGDHAEVQAIARAYRQRLVDFDAAARQRRPHPGRPAHAATERAS